MSPKPILCGCLEGLQKNKPITQSVPTDPGLVHHSFSLGSSAIPDPSDSRDDLSS